MVFLAAPTLAVWAALEVGLRVREAVQGKGRRERDRGTRVLVALSLGAAIGVAAALAARTPGGGWVAGVPVMWLGLGVRVWAVAALGGGFRTTVEVEPDQAVVTTGPYRWIRHPAYAGLLLIAGGFGLAAGSLLAAAAGLLLALPAIVRRIHVEEAELESVLGDAYRAYEARTSRLVPGVW
jgi:protein-S-isoprenylcysteine O-methyltransferase Ste14